MTYEELYLNPAGRTSRTAFTSALIVLLAAVVFYVLLANRGLNKDWVLTTLMLPALALHARRLHDMGQTGWLLVVPAVVDGIAMGLHMTKSELQHPALPVAVVVTVAFMTWGVMGKGQAGANRFGEAATA